MTQTLTTCKVHQYYVLPDKKLFRLLMKVSLVSLLFYVLSSSVPSWCIFHDNLTNITQCSRPIRHVIHDWPHDSAELTISASLWFMHVKLVHEEDVRSVMVPYNNLPREHIRNSYAYFPPVSETVLNVAILILIVLGIYFCLKADRRPASLVYFGLSPLSILTATATWMTLALPNASDNVLDQAEYFCATHTEVQTDLFLHVICGTCAILTFIVSCLLIHMAMSFNSTLQHARELHVSQNTSCVDSDKKILNLDDETKCSCECV